MEVNDYAENYGTGWIKVYRSIRNHWVFQNEKYLKAWLIMLLEMNHTEQKTLIEGELITCKRGQKIYSLDTWTGIFGQGWSKQKTRTFLKLLEKDQMIGLEGLRKTTRVTIINYNTYQDSQHTNNTEITRSQHAANTEITSIKELKNEKNEKKKDITKEFEIFWSVYPKRKGKRLGKKECLDYLKKNDLDFERLIANTKNYAASQGAKDGYAKDPIRFLRKYWEDWNEPEVPQYSGTDEQRKIDEYHDNMFKDNPEYIKDLAKKMRTTP